MYNNLEIDFEKEMSLELLEERLEMVAIDTSCLGRKCGEGIFGSGNGGDAINGDGGDGLGISTFKTS